MSRRTINPDLTPEAGPRKRPVRTALALALGALAAPVVYEVTAASAARWQSLNGPYTHADTPVLDALAAAGRESARFVANFAHERLHDLPWQSHILMIVGALAFGLGYWILRRA